jgi:hypothetical protein
VVAGPADALAALEPLLLVRRAWQRVVVLPDAVERVLANPARLVPRGAEALLVVGPRQRSPRRVLPGLFVHDAEGTRVPVGWLPDVGPERLRIYAEAAARVVRRARSGATGPLMVLGQWEDRFLRVGLRTSRWVTQHEPELPVFHWTAERISRSDMLAGLTCGPGLAMYFGHGRPRGWAGYHGVRLEHFPDRWPEPMGALLALCCENASRLHTGLSFAEQLVLRGVAGGMLAATAKTRHEDNRRWGPALCEALTERGATTLAELVLRADVPPKIRDGGPYRFIGDPAIPLVGAAGAAAKAARVFAPAADDPLPAWRPSAA